MEIRSIRRKPCWFCPKLSREGNPGLSNSLKGIQGSGHVLFTYFWQIIIVISFRLDFFVSFIYSEPNKTKLFLFSSLFFFEFLSWFVSILIYDEYTYKIPKKLSGCSLHAGEPAVVLSTQHFLKSLLSLWKECCYNFWCSFQYFHVLTIMKMVRIGSKP